MAGALGVALEKRDTYRLGDGALPHAPETVDRAVRVFVGTAALVVAVALAVAIAGRSRA
jgi:cobalamin biosynthesis protein CobD/CbiB